MSNEISQQELERIASIVSALQTPSGDTPAAKTPTEITACIPVYNAIKTLGMTMHSLGRGMQSMPIALKLCDNGSTDGSQAFVRDLLVDSVTRTHWLTRFPRGVSAMQVPQHDDLPARFPREYFNIRECFRAMWPAVETPYLLMMDADVEMPQGALRTLYDILRMDGKIGQAGIQYDEVSDHVQHGCALIRIELALQVLPRLTIDTCMCRQINTLLDGMGYRSVHVPAMSARHSRNEV